MAILHLYLGRGYFEGMSDPQVNGTTSFRLERDASRRAGATHAIAGCVVHLREHAYNSNSLGGGGGTAALRLWHDLLYALDARICDVWYVCAPSRLLVRYFPALHTRCMAEIVQPPVLASPSACEYAHSSNVLGSTRRSWTCR